MPSKISSKSTFITKKLFPWAWFGFLTLMIVINLTSGAFKKSPLSLVIPLVMGAFGYVIMRSLVFDLMDEVYDCTDSLLVKNKGQEQRINLADIVNVSVSANSRPPRITLRLANPGVFGSDITFSPEVAFSLNPFAKNAVAEDLITRVDRARSARYRSGAH